MAGQNPLALGLIIIGIFGLLIALYLSTFLRNKKRNEAESKTYALTFFAGATFATIFLIHLFFLQPIPGHYVEVYGTGYALFALSFFVLGALVYTNTEQSSMRFASLPLGAGLLVLSFVINAYSLSKSPTASMILFGLPGIGALLLAGNRSYKERNPLLVLALLVFLVFGALAFYSGATALYGHVGSALAPAA